MCRPLSITQARSRPATGSKDLVSLFDFGPTILEIAGVTPPEWMEARSLVPYFNASHDPSRERVFSEHSEDRILNSIEFMTMIRQGPWKLVHLLHDKEGQLFNLEEDPRETHNLWDDPAHAEVKKELIDAILSWRLESAKKTQGFVRELAKG